MLHLTYQKKMLHLFLSYLNVKEYLDSMESMRVCKKHTSRWPFRIEMETTIWRVLLTVSYFRHMISYSRET